MYLKSGRIPRKIYPGPGGEHVETISLGQHVDKLFVVMNGFDLSFDEDAHYIKKAVVNLWVVHVSGSKTAELHCTFNLNDANTSGDTFWALCDYVLIGSV